MNVDVNTETLVRVWDWFKLHGGIGEVLVICYLSAASEKAFETLGMTFLQVEDVTRHNGERAVVLLGEIGPGHEQTCVKLELGASDPRQCKAVDELFTFGFDFDFVPTESEQHALERQILFERLTERVKVAQAQMEDAQKAHVAELDERATSGTYYPQVFAQ